MSEAMDIDSGYDARDRDLSPRRDRGDHHDDRRRERSPRRPPPRDFNRRDPPLEALKDSNAPPGSRDTDRNYDNSIFVGNLSYDCDSQALRNHFGGVGSIVRADVITQGGRPRGMATVEFSSKDEVDRAIREFNGSSFNSREIFVRQDNPPPSARNDRRGGDRGGDRFGDRRGGFNDRDGGDRFGDRGGYGGDRFSDRGSGRGDRFGDRGGFERTPRTDAPLSGPYYEVFVGNLPFRAHWGEIKDIFKPFGNVLRVLIKEDEYTGRSRGFGFVYFEKHEEALEAISKLDGYELQGRRLDVHEGKKSSSAVGGAGLPRNSDFTIGVDGEGEKCDMIFVANLPYATTNQDLKDLFGTVGEVVRAEIKYTGQGRPSGLAVVQFSDAEMAEGCVIKLNGYDYGGRNLKISFARRT